MNLNFILKKCIWCVRVWHNCHDEMIQLYCSIASFDTYDVLEVTHFDKRMNEKLKRENEMKWIDCVPVQQGTVYTCNISTLFKKKKKTKKPIGLQQVTIDQFFKCQWIEIPMFSHQFLFYFQCDLAQYTRLHTSQPNTIQLNRIKFFILIAIERYKFASHSNQSILIDWVFVYLFFYMRSMACVSFVRITCWSFFFVWKMFPLYALFLMALIRKIRSEVR